jgi:UDP-N-acetyl-D-mannosaminuronic acid transferase (WecB/TagA/CpsF family)
MPKKKHFVPIPISVMRKSCRAGEEADEVMSDSDKLIGRAFALHRTRLLDVDIGAVTLDDAVTVIESRIAKRERNDVCVTGVHDAIECRRDSELRETHNNADLMMPDGMSFVFMARRPGFRSISHAYGLDLMRRLTEISAEKGYRQFHHRGGADNLKCSQRSQSHTFGCMNVDSTTPFFDYARGRECNRAH